MICFCRPPIRHHTPHQHRPNFRPGPRNQRPPLLPKTFHSPPVVRPAIPQQANIQLQQQQLQQIQLQQMQAQQQAQAQQVY